MWLLYTPGTRVGGSKTFNATLAPSDIVVSRVGCEIDTTSSMPAALTWALNGAESRHRSAEIRQVKFDRSFAS